MNSEQYPELKEKLEKLKRSIPYLEDKIKTFIYIIPYGIIVNISI